jgi:hypothetical protein
VAAVAAAQAQEAVGQDAALQERVELIVHELRQVGSGSGLSLREDGRGVLLHRSSCTSPRTTTPAGFTASCRARGAT